MGVSFSEEEVTAPLLYPIKVHIWEKATHHRSTVCGILCSFRVSVLQIRDESPSSSYLYKWLTRGLTPKEFIQFLNVRSSLVSPR